jgi:hypothetical protein
MSEANRLEEPILECPHCKEFVIIEKLNCGIFRHGIIKTTGKQMDPHAPKEMCDNFLKNKIIYGCGKPFQIIQTGEKFEIVICDYI